MVSKSKLESNKKYFKTEKGKEARKRANAKYRRSDKGKKAQQYANREGRCSVCKRIAKLKKQSDPTICLGCYNDSRIGVECNYCNRNDVRMIRVKKDPICVNCGRKQKK